MRDSVRFGRGNDHPFMNIRRRTHPSQVQRGEISYRLKSEQAS